MVKVGMFMTTQLVTVAVSECVIVAFFILSSSPVILVSQYKLDDYIDGSIVPVCVTEVDTFWPAFFFVGAIFVFYLLPLVILVALYGIIACHLMANPGLVTAHQHLHHRYRKQVRNLT